MTEVALGLAVVCLPAAVWRVHVIGLAEIYRRIAGELPARAGARDAYDAALQAGRIRARVEFTASFETRKGR